MQKQEPLSKKEKKRNRNKTTSSHTEEPPAVSGSKRHLAKNGESVPITVAADTSRRPSIFLVGEDPRAMNEHSALQRTKKGNRAIVQSWSYAN